MRVHNDGRIEDSRSRGVAERTERARTCGSAVSSEATERELRRAAYTLLNHYMTMHQVIAEHLRLPPVEQLILIATTTGNVQRVLRPDAIPDAVRGRAPLSAGLVVPMSRRAISRVTGIPTETVRRHVARMVARGVLRSTPGGVLAPSRLAEDWALAAVLRLVESHATCTERLVSLGALSLPTRRKDATKKR
jgi:hypothetical protein